MQDDAIKEKPDSNKYIATAVVHNTKTQRKTSESFLTAFEPVMKGSARNALRVP